MRTLVLLFLSGLFVSTLCAAAPAPISKAIVEGKEYPVYAFFKDVKPLSVANPIYPVQARQEGRGGNTSVGAVVGEQGKVVSTFVAKSDGKEDIQQAACVAVKRWKFPKLKDGDKPISYIVFVPIVMTPP